MQQRLRCRAQIQVSQRLTRFRSRRYKALSSRHPLFTNLEGYDSSRNISPLLDKVVNSFRCLRRCVPTTSSLLRSSTESSSSDFQSSHRCLLDRHFLISEAFYDFFRFRGLCPTAIIKACRLRYASGELMLPRSRPRSVSDGIIFPRNLISH